MVLDDAVVDHGDARGGLVRVGVGLGDRAVGGPAGVGDAGVAFGGGLGQQLIELGHLAHAAALLQGAVAQHGEAGGIIAAVFEAVQAFEQDGRHIALGHSADNAAHAVYSLLWGLLGCVQPSMDFCPRARQMVKASPGASFVMVEPAAM